MDHEQSQAPQPELSDAELAGDHEEKAWPVHIDVYLDDDTRPNPRFEIISTLPSYQNAKGEEILEFKNNHRPGFKIHFHLRDRTGKGYGFPTSAEDAVWSRIGDECPGSKVNQVFDPKRVVPRGPFGVPMLVVYMANEQVDGEPIGRFQYTLNVVKDGGTPLPLDPGGDAGNGPRTFRR